MHLQTIDEKISMLPDDLRKEAECFIDKLLQKATESMNRESREPGFLKGKIQITDDFDEPLDEFREYAS